MREQHIGTVVVTKAGRVIGIATDRDLAIRVLGAGLPPTTRIDQVMTREAICSSPDDEVVEALRLMRVHQIHRIPVADRGKLAGIISISDIAIQASESEDIEITLADLCERTAKPRQSEDEHRRLEARHI